MIFEYYVLNYDINRNKVIMFNVFNNIRLNEATYECVERYVNQNEEYTYKIYSYNDDIELHGYEAFKHEILNNIKWQEWSRVEYEIGVTEPFPNKKSKIEKWDCYSQCEPNIDAICGEIIRQYVNYKENIK